MRGPAIRAGRTWHVTFTGVHGLEPEASFDEDGELLVGESTPDFRIRDEKCSTILLAREQPGFGLWAGDMAGDTFVGKIVCSDSELALLAVVQIAEGGYSSVYPSSRISHPRRVCYETRDQSYSATS